MRKQCPVLSEWVHLLTLASALNLASFLSFLWPRLSPQTTPFLQPAIPDSSKVLWARTGRCHDWDRLWKRKEKASFCKASQVIPSVCVCPLCDTTHGKLETRAGAGCVRGLDSESFVSRQVHLEFEPWITGRLTFLIGSWSEKKAQQINIKN